jgi:serine/threonine protein kinase
MSPEQILGRAVDPRTDVYALGVCLYEMLAGQRLFSQDSAAGQADRAAAGGVMPPSTRNPHVPKSLDGVVARALQINPNDRQQSAAELAGELRRSLASSGLSFDRRQLGRYVKSLFAEEVESEYTQLRKFERWMRSLHSEGK